MMHPDDSIVRTALDLVRTAVGDRCDPLLRTLNVIDSAAKTSERCYRCELKCSKRILAFFSHPLIRDSPARS